VKNHLIVPAIFMSSPVAFVVSGIVFTCGVPAGIALAASFGACTLAGWILTNRFDRR
jgi:uncharacterized membrane protein YbjE (DUF340 family)